MGILVGTAWGERLAGIDALALVYQASWIVQLVLLLLVVLSVFSWAIILSKWLELRRAQQDSESFLQVYHERSMEDAYEAAKDLDRSPLAAVFLSAYGELKRLARASGRSLTVTHAHVDALKRHVGWTGSREGLRLERGFGFLATTGSAAPFVGLFGTVIGIINAFQNIGRSGSASLAVVAPGIAEALIATAVGLFAAIPATVFYNIFVGKLRGITAAIDLFSAEYEEDLRRMAGASSQPAPGPRE
ncbi:MAG: MotA/TolQ/ExbB proton channel family protein [Myxococcales bacterium]|nr:MotA/TolQ/ExbB proton channel family protein [Myxococcales bacterium]MDH5566484.1 MotA/TolQ/ExbB proton channel family protein [Myxococcales bacterium]